MAFDGNDGAGSADLVRELSESVIGARGCSAARIAMRLAVGASRFRLVCQLLSESLLLAIAGALLGVAMAMVLSRGLIRLISTSDNPLAVDLTLDWRTLAFTAAAATCTCLLFGLLPALRAAFLAPVAAVRGGSRLTAGRERLSFRRALVTVQIALSLILLFGALLFVRSLNNLLTIDPTTQTIEASAQK